MDGSDYLVTAGIILIILSYIYVKLENKHTKDLCPQSRYPHEVLFPYFCVYVICLATFLGMGLINGLILIIASVALSIVMIVVLPHFFSNH